MTLPLSILDVAPVGDGQTAADALAASLELAKLADRLGYCRLWYAEHHNMPAIASTAPELLIARAAMVTQRLRLGSGGVMLPNHAPYAVVERYKALAALHPGRIDLGLGRAPGTDQLTALALRRSHEAVTANDFPQQLAELIAFGRSAFPGDHPFRRVVAYPDDVPLPPLWLLGSSDFSAILAARHGLGYAYAAHFSPQPPEAAMRAYRALFTPGELTRPHAILAVSALCAETRAEARRLAASMELVWVGLRTGQLGKIPTPERALAYPYDAVEQQIVASYRRLSVVGTPAEVVAGIQALVQRTQADEVMVTTMVHDPAARLRSYTMLADAWLGATASSS